MVRLTKEEMGAVKNSVPHWRCNCTWPIAQKYTIGAHPRCTRCGLEIAPSILFPTTAGHQALEAHHEQ